jgi:hypothetical protein
MAEIQQVIIIIKNLIVKVGYLGKFVIFASKADKICLELGYFSFS